MSHDDITTSVPDTAPTAAVEAERADWFLQSLVKMVNGTTMEIGITLQVDGLLVSGLLVSEDKYFSGFADTITSGMQGLEAELVSEFRELFARHGKSYTKPDDKPKPRPTYIHLKDARFFSTAGQPVPANAGVWWRGRLSCVGGFVLGRLGASEE